MTSIAGICYYDKHFEAILYCFNDFVHSLLDDGHDIIIDCSSTSYMYTRTQNVITCHSNISATLTKGSNAENVVCLTSVWIELQMV